MENNYSSAVTKAKKALSDITGEVVKLDERLKSTIAQLEKYGTSQIPSKTTDQLRQQADAIKRLEGHVTRLNAANKKRNTASKILTEAEAKERVEVAALNRDMKNYVSTLSKVVGGMAKLTAKLKIAKKAYLDIQTEGKKAGESQKKYNIRLKQAQKEFQKLQNKANAAKKAVSNFSNTSFGGLVRSAKSLMTAFGVIGGITLFANAAKGAFNLTKKLDSMRFSMQAVITNSREFIESQEFLRQIAQDYGADLLVVTNRFIKFRAATQQAGLTAKETQAIFGTMTKAAGVLGLKSDELQGVFLALEQMVSKGKITTEELRRQLGERLPGAMDIMANSMGVTTSELDQMLKKGQVITKDVLPGFAKQVEIAFGLDKIKKVETLQAATTRLSNAWVILVEDFNKGNNASNLLMKVFDGLAKNLPLIVKGVGYLIAAWVGLKTVQLALVAQTYLLNGGLATHLWYVKANIVAAWNDVRAKTAQTTSTGILATATNILKGAFMKLWAVMIANPILALIAVVAVVAVSMRDFGKTTLETAEELNALHKETLDQVSASSKLVNETTILMRRYEDLHYILNKTVEEQKEYNKVVAEIGKAYPEVIVSVNEYGVAQEINLGILKQLLDNERQLAKVRAENASVDLFGSLEDQTEKLAWIEAGNAAYVKGAGKVIKTFGELKSVVGDGVNQTRELLKGDKLEAYLKWEQSALKAKLETERLTKALKDQQEQLADPEGYAARKAKEAQDAIDKTKTHIKILPGLRDSLKKAEDSLAEFGKKGFDTLEKEGVEKVKKLRDSIKELQTEITEITGESFKKKREPSDSKAENEAERRLRASLKSNQDLLTAQAKTEKIRLNVIISANQAILDNDESTFLEKIDARRNIETTSNTIAKNEAEYQVAMADAVLQYYKDSAKKTTKEKEDALKVFLAKTQEIAEKQVADEEQAKQKGLKNTDKIFKSEFDKKKKSIEDQKALDSEEVEEISNAQGLYATELKALQLSLANKEISVKTYNSSLEVLTLKHEKNIAKIKRDIQLKTLKDTIDMWQKLIDADPFMSAEDKLEAEKMLADAKMALSDQVLDNELENIATEKAAREAFVKVRTELIGQASTILADSLGLDADNLQTLMLDVVDGFGKSADDILGTIGNVSAVVGDIMSSIHQNNIDNIDEQIQRNKDKYAEALADETLSVEQRSDMEAERDLKEAQLEKKKRAERTKQAKTEKAFAVFQIGLKTAQAILGIWAEVPKFDFGISAGLLTGIVSALGAGQMAAVLAAPIPKFEKGTMNAPGGMALVDEKRPEIHTDRHGNIKSFGANAPNLRYLEQGDKIYKSHEDFFDYGAKDSIQRSVWNMNTHNLKAESQDKFLAMEIKKMVQALDRKNMSVKLNQKINVADDLNFLFSKNDTL